MRRPPWAYCLRPYSWVLKHALTELILPHIRRVPSSARVSPRYIGIYLLRVNSWSLGYEVSINVVPKTLQHSFTIISFSSRHRIPECQGTRGPSRASPDQLILFRWHEIRI